MLREVIIYRPKDIGLEFFPWILASQIACDLSAGIYSISTNYNSNHNLLADQQFIFPTNIALYNVLLYNKTKNKPNQVFSIPANPQSSCNPLTHVHASDIHVTTVVRNILYNFTIEMNVLKVVSMNNDEK